MAEQNSFQEKQNEVYCNVNQNKNEEWQAGYTGQITLPDGQRYFIDVWDGIGKNSGQPYRRVRIGSLVKGSNTQPQAPIQNTQSQIPAENLQDLDEDSLPF